MSLGLAVAGRSDAPHLDSLVLRGSKQRVLHLGWLCLRGRRDGPCEDWGKDKQDVSSGDLTRWQTNP